MITQCPYCARRFKAPEDKEGTVFQCACGKAFVVQASDGTVLLTPAMKAPRPKSPTGPGRPDNPLLAVHSRPQRPISKSAIAKSKRPIPPAKTGRLRSLLFFLSCLAAATIIVGITWRATNSDASGKGDSPDKSAGAKETKKAGLAAIHKSKPPLAARPVKSPPVEAKPATASRPASPTSAQAAPPPLDPAELARLRNATQQVFDQARELAAREQNDQAVNMLADMLNEYPQEAWPEGATEEYERLARIVTRPVSRPAFFDVASPK